MRLNRLQRDVAGPLGERRKNCRQSFGPVDHHQHAAIGEQREASDDPSSEIRAFAA